MTQFRGSFQTHCSVGKICRKHATASARNPSSAGESSQPGAKRAGHVQSLPSASRMRSLNAVSVALSQ